jgi:hypothetical protein
MRSLFLVIAVTTLPAMKMINRLGSVADRTDVLITHNSEAGRDGQADTHAQSTWGESRPRQHPFQQSPSIPVENSPVSAYLKRRVRDEGKAEARGVRLDRSTDREVEGA